MDIFDQLEEKITLALETVELLNMETSELKEEVKKLQLENTQLAVEKSENQARLSSLLERFEAMESQQSETL